MEKEVESELPTALDSLPLEEESQQIAGEIVKTHDQDRFKDLVAMFNMAQMKKDILCALKMSDIRDMGIDQALERLRKNPDEVSHKDLMGYIQMAQDQIDRASQSVNQPDQKALIQINNSKQELNVSINGSEMNRDSKENVREAVAELLKLAQRGSDSDGCGNVVDADVSEGK